MLAQAAEPDVEIPNLQGMISGYAAFCRASVIDELQIIGDPRKLAQHEAEALARIFGSKKSYLVKGPDGEEGYLRSMCMPHWDFKFVLGSADKKSVSILYCADCSQAFITIDRRVVRCPDLANTGELFRLLEGWFGDWRPIATRNRQSWEQQFIKRE
jgi:hypothetical protein